MLDRDGGVPKESVETASCPGDFVECDVSRLGGRKMIKDNDNACEDVEVETDRYTDHRGYVLQEETRHPRSGAAEVRCPQPTSSLSNRSFHTMISALGSKPYTIYNLYKNLLEERCSSG